MGIEVGTAALIASLVGTGASVASGFMAGKPKTSTSSSEPVYTPEQEWMRKRTGDLLSYRMDQPDAGLFPMKIKAIGDVNKTYLGVNERIQKAASERGYGNSGVVGKNIFDAEISRAGDIGDVEGKFAGLQLDQENKIVDQALRFAFAGPGEQRTSTGPDTSAAAGMAAAGEGLTSLATLQMLLNRSAQNGSPPQSGMVFQNSGQYGPGWYRP